MTESLGFLGLRSDWATLYIEGVWLTQDFVRGPDKRAKGSLALCPCPGVEEVRLV